MHNDFDDKNMESSWFAVVAAKFLCLSLHIYRLFFIRPELKKAENERDVLHTLECALMWESVLTQLFLFQTDTSDTRELQQEGTPYPVSARSCLWLREAHIRSKMITALFTPDIHLQEIPWPFSLYNTNSTSHCHRRTPGLCILSHDPYLHLTICLV